MFDFIADTVVQTVMITYFVLCMILLLEFLNVKSNGAGQTFMLKHPGAQILIATLLGLLPGCLGSYTLVSLFSHNIVGAGALVANLLATTGDESFFMFALMPQKAVFITIILALLALASGYIVNFFYKKNTLTLTKLPVHFQIHDSASEHSDFKTVIFQLKHISLQRALILLSLLIFVILLLSGIIKSDHNHDVDSLTQINILSGAHHSDDDHEHIHSIDWVSVTFLIVSAITFFVVLTVGDHFLKEHLWHHVIQKHLPKVFLWTLFALAVVGFLNNYLNVSDWISDNIYLVMLAALLVGLIPESGPHMIFISLFLSGQIPICILLANSIVQDGHGAIPLFAENKKEFFLVKAYKFVLAAIIGYSALLFS